MHHESFIAFKNVSTGVQVLHTPGHTPDELALWDEGERMLYVGDTVYEWEPIIFPLEGDIRVWMKSMDYLLDFVIRRQNKNSARMRSDAIRINAGHCTSAVDAEDVLRNGRGFIEDVVAGKVPVKGRTMVDGVKIVSYARNDGRFSLRCPEKLVLEARRKVSL
jgi:glyoxylase-like metal-dependent hydrolase (beta-lactamase superfamily II)